MRLLREFSSFSFLPIAFWLALQSFSLFASTQSQAAYLVATNAGDSGVIQVVICTPEGFKTVFIDESGEPIDGSNVNFGAECLWCQLLNEIDAPVATEGNVVAVGFNEPSKLAPTSSGIRVSSPLLAERFIRAPPRA